MGARVRIRLALAGLLIAAVSLSGCGSPASSSTTPAGATRSPDRALAGIRLVSVAHLHDNLTRSMVLDARSAAEYAAGHVPGAINVQWQSFSRVGSGKPGDPGWGTLKTASQISAVLSQLGLDEHKQIVVYTSPGTAGADGRIVWMLQMAGIGNSKCLDGGFKAWADAGYPVSTDAVNPTPLTVKVASLDESLRITTDKVVSQETSLTLIDVRTAAEFAGTDAGGASRPGHIPGAVNIPYASWFKADGRLVATSDLVALLQAQGVSLDANVVVYDGSGVRSALATLILDGLGYHTRNYDGGYFEWAGIATRGVAK